jgi:hypothetical protein
MGQSANHKNIYFKFQPWSRDVKIIEGQSEVSHPF